MTPSSSRGLASFRARANRRIYDMRSRIGEWLQLNQRQLAVDHQQHAVEFMAAAQDQAGRRDHAVHALLAREPRVFLDAIERDFGGAAEYRKHRAVLQEIDGVISPFAVGDHAPVEVQDAIEFEAVEGNSMWHWARSGNARRCAALAWIGILQNRTHRAPPVTSLT